MQPIAVLLSLLSLSAVALAVPAELKRSCIVPQVIFSDLQNPFHIVLESANRKIDGKTITYKSSRHQLNPGIYHNGFAQTSKLTTGKLSLRNRAIAFIVEPRGRPRFRRVAFAKGPKAPSKYEAYYKCSKKGKAETVIRPAGDDAGLVFCVYPNANRHGEYGLWVKPPGSSPDCIDVFAVAVPV